MSEIYSTRYNHVLYALIKDRDAANCNYPNGPKNMRVKFINEDRVYMYPSINFSPLENAVYNKEYSRKIIKLLLDNGARQYGLLAFLVQTKNWIVARMFLEHGAFNEVTGTIKVLYKKYAPLAERRCFDAFCLFIERIPVLIHEMKKKVEALYFAPPIEIKPGIIRPGGQGYYDAMKSFEENNKV
jgi:hypothetical protein